MILDLHIHSKYSFDCLSEPKDIIRIAKKRGLNGVAITDHNTVRGGIEARRINDDPDFLVIIGSEIATDIGDIIGLFLNAEVESRHGIEVIEEIHSQGGIAVLPHAYIGHRLSEETLKEIDAIEGFNSRTNEESNKKAMQLAERYNKPIIAGSDAHFLSEIGASRVVVNSTDILVEILKGGVGLEATIKTPLYMQSLSQIIKSIKLGEYEKIPVQFASIVAKILKNARRQ